jgi:hypothetical protein
LVRPNPRRNPGFVHGTVRVYTEQVTLASQAVADIIVLGMIPKGSVFLYGILETDTSLGSTTLAISSATLNSAATTATVVTAGKYRAAATFTATDTPTFFGATLRLALPRPRTKSLSALSPLRLLPRRATSK